MMASPDGAQPAVFLDRDGTLMRDVDYCDDPTKVQVFPGATDALRLLKQSGYKLIIITNQSGIGRGYFTDDQYHAVHREFLHQLGDGLIDGAYYCPSAPGENSPRRKPAPGMVFEAQSEHSLDLKRSFFVGDKSSDVECGRNAGVKTILVQTGYGADANQSGADHVANDLTHAVKIILESTR